jgi:hypothetical protein
LIFAHDDIEILTPHFLPRLKRHLSRYDMVGVAGTSRFVDAFWAAAGPPYIFGQVGTPVGEGYTLTIFGTPARVVEGIQALDGLFISCRRSVAESVGFDERTFDGFHAYDVDFAFRGFLARARLAVACDLHLLHGSPGDFGEHWDHYAGLLNRKHFSGPSPLLRRMRNYCCVGVATKAELLEVMEPSLQTTDPFGVW